MDFVMKIMFMDDKIVRAIDNFDYPDKVPKIVFFLDNDNALNDDIVYLLGYLSKIGFDIVIFNPSGTFSATNIISQERINYARLDTMNYNRTYSSISNKTKKQKGFFNKLFG